LAYIDSQQERDDVARLNLLAGKRARASSAYASPPILRDRPELQADNGWIAIRLQFELELHSPNANSWPVADQPRNVVWPRFPSGAFCSKTRLRWRVPDSSVRHR